MKAMYRLGCAVLGLTCLVNQNANATLYDLVNQGIAPATATGTITTDGALGVLSQSDITALNITVADGTHSFTLTLPDLLFFGSDLSATANGLFFNYAGTDGGFFAGVNLGSTINGYCAASLGQSCEFVPASEAMFVASVLYQGPVEISEVQIAVAAVPEPSTWAMLILGFFGIGVMASRRRTAVPSVA